MARIRTIKPEFFTSEDIVALSAWARLLYVALWCEADKEGRLLWKPKTFKMRYFPADSIDIETVCEELLESNLVSLYGDGLAHIPTFRQHQHVNPREKESKLPAPDASVTRAQRVPDASRRVDDACPTRADATVTRREEGNGREGNNTPSECSAQVRASEVIPEDINPAAWADWDAHRRKRRKPISDRAAREQWRLLSSLTYEQQAECIAASIRNDWQGLFPEKFANPRASPQAGMRGRTLEQDLTDRSWAQ